MVLFGPQLRGGEKIIATDCPLQGQHLYGQVYAIPDTKVLSP